METTGTPRRRARRGEGGRLREQIVEAATALLAEAGDHQDVSVRAVADAVGVTPPSIYLHFPDKGTLLRAVVDRWCAALEEEVARARAGSADPVDRVLAFARAYLTFGLGAPGRYKIIYEGRVLPAFDLPVGDVPGRALLEAAAADVRAAAAGGAVRAADPWATTVLLWQVLHGAISLRINKPGFPWTDAWDDAEVAVRALLHLPEGPGRS